MSKLTAIQVRNAKATEKAHKLSDGNGLYLHIAPSGRKTWRYRYRYKGKESTVVLGEYPKTSLEVARKERTLARDDLNEGKNPSTVKRESKAALLAAEDKASGTSRNSFQVIAEEFIDMQREKWSRDHANAVLATLRADAFPTLGKMSVDTITTKDILKVIRSIESRGSYEIASKVLQRIGAVCRYAVQTGRASYNPASDMKGALKTRKVQHRAALQEHELPEFMKLMKTADIHPTTKMALEFVILTAARSGEVRFATWDEVDLDDGVWRIPAERMKMGTPHTVPIAQQAEKLLKTIGRQYGFDGYIFPGIRKHSKPLSENTLLYALYRMGYHSRATVHGFRAVFSSIANEQGFDKDAIERQLAHQERNRVRAAYHRSEYLEERRRIMQWWADYLYAI